MSSLRTVPFETAEPFLSESALRIVSLTRAAGGAVETYASFDNTPAGGWCFVAVRWPADVPVEPEADLLAALMPESEFHFGRDTECSCGPADVPGKRVHAVCPARTWRFVTSGARRVGR